MDYEEIIKEYLTQCAIFCNRGGSYLLSLSKKNIEELLINKFKDNGYDVSDLLLRIKICEKEVFSYIEEHKGFYSWSLVNEDKLRNRINNVLQKNSL